MDGFQKLYYGCVASLAGLVGIALYAGDQHDRLVDADQALRATASQEWNCPVERIRARIDLKTGTAVAGGCDRDDQFVRMPAGNWERFKGE
jgi:hypothetical protein